MIIYKITEEIRKVEGKECRIYGIAALKGNNEIICAVQDITTVKEKALWLAKRCEQLSLSPIHLKDVVDDYLISDEY